MNAAALAILSILIPAKGWFGPNQPWTVTIKPPNGQIVQLLLTDFSGSTIDPDTKEKRDITKEETIDLKVMFPAITTPGSYILYALPVNKADQGKELRDRSNFLGTPLVISIREDRRRGAPQGPMVVKVDPLRYAVVKTDAGDMTVAFYYDVASNTIANFVRLAEEGFYNDLTFHRVEPGFIIQGGDPRGDGTGGPGYTIDAEFSDRKHEPGVLSMSRNIDPNESPNSPPRAEYANSAGSQFFIALDYKNTAQLDGQYSIFGRVIGIPSLKTLDAIASAPIADKKLAKPEKPVVIKRVEIRPVTAKENPYPALLATSVRDEE